MQISKEIVWYMDENPNKDGTYLYAQFSLDGVTVGGMTDSLFYEYAAAGMAIARGAIAEGYDARVLRLVFETCFEIVMEVLEEEEKK